MKLNFRSYLLEIPMLFFCLTAIANTLNVYEIEDFECIDCTLKSSIKIEREIEFQCIEKPSYRFLLNTYAKTAAPVNDLKSLKPHDKVKVSIKKVNNFGDKINAFLGIIHVYEIKNSTREYITIDNLNKAKTQDTHSFFGIFALLVLIVIISYVGLVIIGTLLIIFIPKHFHFLRKYLVFKYRFREKK